MPGAQESSEGRSPHAVRAGRAVPHAERAAPRLSAQAKAELPPHAARAALLAEVAGLCLSAQGALAVTERPRRAGRAASCLGAQATAERPPRAERAASRAAPHAGRAGLHAEVAGPCLSDQGIQVVAERPLHAGRAAQHAGRAEPCLSAQGAQAVAVGPSRAGNGPPRAPCQHPPRAPDPALVLGWPPAAEPLRDVKPDKVSMPFPDTASRQSPARDDS